MEHPPYETVPPGDTLGLRHLRQALADLDFPQRTSQLRERVGYWRMPTTGAQFEPLARYLDGVPEKSFHTPEEVAEAVARAHPELRD